ncbi:MAG TPA: DUF4183 domain-containing protein [Bacillales bacterium]|nr:DUF4183 domain-containing protein [Bacillales bacterium]
MGLRIVKLFASAATTTTTTAKPTVLKFFYETTAQTTAGNTLTIAVGSFETDGGIAATTLPDLTADNSYFKVEINGVLQMKDTLAYTSGGSGTGQLEITVPVESDPIEAQTPIVLEVVNYDPQSSSTTTITT